MIEYDPLYCDATIRRFEQFTGRKAFLTETNQTFEVVAGLRAADTGKEVA